MYHDIVSQAIVLDGGIDDEREDHIERNYQEGKRFEKKMCN